MNQTFTHEFSARIDKAGINPYVPVPREVSQAFRKRGHVPVRGRLNDISIKATLVPAGGGAHRLYINTEMRKKEKVKVGDVIRLRIELDPEPRLVTLPGRFLQALENDRDAKAAFERLTPSHRREIVTYLNWLKTPEALERNIKKIIAFLSKPEGR